MNGSLTHMNGQYLIRFRIFSINNVQVAYISASKISKQKSVNLNQRNKNKLLPIFQQPKLYENAFSFSQFPSLVFLYNQRELLII